MKVRPKMIFVTSRTKALTFIELLIVIVIIGILVGISIPQFRKTFDNFELENFVKDIYYLSRYLQASAISQAKIHYLNIARAEGKFWATYKVEDEFKNIEGRFGKIYMAPKGVIISIDQAHQPEKEGIYFYPDGSIDEIKIDFENRHNHKVSLIIQGAVGDIKIQ